MLIYTVNMTIKEANEVHESLMTINTMILDLLKYVQELDNEYL